MECGSPLPLFPWSRQGSFQHRIPAGNQLILGTRFHDDIRCDAAAVEQVAIGSKAGHLAQSQRQSRVRQRVARHAPAPTPAGGAEKRHVGLAFQCAQEIIGGAETAGVREDDDRFVVVIGLGIGGGADAMTCQALNLSGGSFQEGVKLFRNVSICARWVSDHTLDVAGCRPRPYRPR